MPTEREASRFAQYTAGRIISKGMQSKDTCGHGEHYLAHTERNGTGGRLRVQRAGQPYVKKSRDVLPVLLRLVVQVLLCVLFWGMLMPATLPWVQSVLLCGGTPLLRVLLISVGIACSLVLFWIDRKCANLWVLVVQALLPIGLVFVIGLLWCYSAARWFSPILLIVAAIVAFLWHRFLADDFPIGLWHFLRSTAIALCVLAVAMVYGGRLDPIVLFPSVTVAAQDRELIGEQHQKALEYLEYDDWMALSVEQKLSFMQSIADYECVYTLGIEPVPVCAAVIENENCLGTYNDEKRLITLQYEVLQGSSPSVVLDTLLHEVRHAYQHRVADMYLEMELRGSIPVQYSSLAVVQTAQAFYQNFGDYKDGNLDFAQYYDQAVERDSRQFAKNRIWEAYAQALGR